MCTRLVEERTIALGQGRTEDLQPRVGAPARRGRHGPAVCGEADEDRTPTMSLAHHPSEVQLAGHRPRGCPRITHVAVPEGACDVPQRPVGLAGAPRPTAWSR